MDIFQSPKNVKNCKSFVEHYLKTASFLNGKSVLKVATVKDNVIENGILDAIVAYVLVEQAEKTSIFVLPVSKLTDGRYALKCIHETEYPFYLSCPIQLLKKSTEPHKRTEWYDLCYQYHQEKEEEKKAKKEKEEEFKGFLLSLPNGAAIKVIKGVVQEDYRLVKSISDEKKVYVDNMSQNGRLMKIKSELVDLNETRIACSL